MKDARPVLDEARCVACGQCALVCAPMVLSSEGGQPRIDHADWCSGCLQCAAVCATSAIRVPPYEVADAPRPAANPAVPPETLMLLLRERRSVRRYTPEPVPRDVLERLVEAGRCAPTGTNAQNVGWIVFSNRPAVEELRDRVLPFYARLFKTVRNPVGRLAVRALAGADAARTLTDYLPVAEEADRRLARGEDRLTHHAPVVMLVHGPKGDTCSDFNGAVALYHASLLAHSLGLGCCFNGFIQNAVNRDGAVRRFVGLPEGHVCTGAMGLGWADPKVRYRRLPQRGGPEVVWR